MVITGLLLVGAPSPGVAPPRRDPPKGLESTPWDGFWVDRCKERLTQAGWTKDYRFSTLNRVQSRKRRGYDPIYCHAPQAMIAQRGPTGVRYYGFTMFNCAMGLAMSRFETIAQEEARRIWGDAHTDPVRGISHMGTYNCRRLRKKPEAQSQHSFGAAIDIGSFWVRGFGIVDVKKHWTPKYPAQKKASEFLRNLAQRLRDEAVFTNVLDPEWDEFHSNHLHLDLAPTDDGLPSAALAKALAMPADATEIPVAAPDTALDAAAPTAAPAAGGGGDSASSAAPKQAP